MKVCARQGCDRELPPIGVRHPSQRFCSPTCRTTEHRRTSPRRERSAPADPIETSDHAVIRARMEAIPRYADEVEKWLEVLRERAKRGHIPVRGHTAAADVGHCPPCDAASILSPDVVRSRR